MKSKNLWIIRIGLCSSISLHLHSCARLTNDWANQFRGCLNFSEVYGFRIFLLVLKENLKFLITHTSLSLSALGSFFSFFFGFNLSFSLLEKKKKFNVGEKKSTAVIIIKSFFFFVYKGNPILWDYHINISIGFLCTNNCEKVPWN